ncbi:MAG: hypothetical protein JXA99_03540 [Candidatus Lokiarchaeota archaeon]|nr:hypothetical protein [Candidatus Lokiarchaeota archaeon]
MKNIENNENFNNYLKSINRGKNLISSMEKLNEIQNEKNYSEIRNIGEMKVCEELLRQYGDNNIQIDISPSKGVDLIVYFIKLKKIINIEVKSTAFKNDYLKDMWIYGIPIKTKDFEEFDLLAMVNFIPKIIKSNVNTTQIEKYNDQKECVIFYFNQSDFNILLPSPFMILPSTNLMYLKKSKDNIGKIKRFFDNFYKGIVIPPEKIFDTCSFKEHLNFLKFKNCLNYPNWFGKNEECRYIREYHKSIRDFYEEIIIKDWDRIINIQKNINLLGNESLSKFKEFYPINDNYCDTCKMDCRFRVIQR